MTGGRWLSYIDAAACLGITPDAIRQRVKRGVLQGARGNDGKPKVWVTDQPITHDRFDATDQPIADDADDRSPPIELDAQSVVTVLCQRHDAEIMRLQQSHDAALCAERSLWLERIDAAEIRAERVEERLDQVLDLLLAERRQPVSRVVPVSWWRWLFGER
jgi:hypothetical protein